MLRPAFSGLPGFLRRWNRLRPCALQRQDSNLNFPEWLLRAKLTNKQTTKKSYIIFPYYRKIEVRDAELELSPILPSKVPIPLRILYSKIHQYSHQVLSCKLDIDLSFFRATALRSSQCS